MKKLLGLIVLFSISFGILSAQNAEDKVKMFNAQQKFYAGDFKGALNLYSDVLKANPNDANVMFHVAECNYALKMYKEATAMVEKAKAINPKANEGLPLLSGRINQKEGKLDEALTDYNLYKTIVNSSKIKESDVDIFISQINKAKELMAAPVNVPILNMGDVINSDQDDKAPAVSADGKLMIFTSRRPGRSSSLDVEGDGGYFEDIYMSRWDSIRNMWAEPELIPGALNTDGHDACTSISPDGKQIFLYKNDIEEHSRGGDVFVSKISSSGKWGAPKAMGSPVNTTYWEGGACISPDGKTLYIVSERKGGFGHGDIYVAKKKSGSEWETPVNIGPEVNSEFDEGGLFLAPDGKTLFFASNGPNSMGGYDIFKTVLENGKWSKPVNMGYPINSVNDDMCLTVTVDAKTGYFTSNRKGGFGERDLYSIDLSNYRVLEKEMIVVKDNTPAGPVMAILKGDVFDATIGSGMDAEIFIYNEDGTQAGSTNASPENGEYFITLQADKTYTIKINKKGFKAIEEKVTIKAAKQGATTVVKHYLLYKAE